MSSIFKLLSRLVNVEENDAYDNIAIGMSLLMFIYLVYTPVLHAVRVELSLPKRPISSLYLLLH